MFVLWKTLHLCFQLNLCNTNLLLCINCTFVTQDMNTENRLTPDACALMGDVVLQVSPEFLHCPPAAHTPIIHQEEGFAVVVQIVGVSWLVLNVISGRKAPLQTDNTTVSSQTPHFSRHLPWPQYLGVDKLLSILDHAPRGHSYGDHFFSRWIQSCSTEVSHSFTHTAGNAFSEAPGQNPRP